MSEAEHKKQVKALAAKFKLEGVPSELNQHKWKRLSGMTVCKVCGLIKGSGFTKCHSQGTT